MSDLETAVETLKKLIAFPSVSSDTNAEVAQWVGRQLEGAGFQVEQTEYTDAQGLRKVNVAGRRDPVPAVGNEMSGGLAYFCHSDVVPPGDWSGPGGAPFVGVIQQDRLYGRGACDMKGSLAAMLTVAAMIGASDQSRPLWIVCTADEEVGFQGAQHLVENSTAYREIVAAQPLSIIGEPTGMKVVHAHKGICGFEITSHGRAAHSSTRDGINANEAMVPMLQTLLELSQRCERDESYSDHRFDPPTLSWNFGIREGGTAINITPERSIAWVSLRPMPEIDGGDLVIAAKTKAESLGLEFKLVPGGDPMWVDPKSPCVGQLCQLAGGRPETVCYSTDGGELGELRQRVVWGPGDIAQAHTTDEWLGLSQLAVGIELYAAAIRKWCCTDFS